MAQHLTDVPGRRRFLRGLIGAGGAAIAAATFGRSSAAAQAPTWGTRLGLQIYTVRDRLAKDFEGTIAAIAEAGYTEVELFGSLGERTARQVRAILDQHRLSAPSTHIAVSPGPDLEQQLEACQILGSIALAPAETEGLGWELREIVNGGHLGKTIFVFPPLPPSELGRRWDHTAEILRDAGASVGPLPAPAGVVHTLQIGHDESVGVTWASTRDEATYRTAVDRALELRANFAEPSVPTPT